ncbi:MAG: PKD domain-containing protein, partial [Bacteroidota bacterium]|nr:PKD domain-containing protein [Bacteroidota bacterium]
MKKLRSTYYFFVAIILIIISSQKAFPQLEAKHWYFGYKNAFKFENNQPVLLYDNKMSTLYGTATISDKYGKLLFYTNGTTIWNKNHDTLKNGYGLNGGYGAMPSALIIPQPGNTNLYYFFTVINYSKSNQGFWYHIVDITKDNGKGEVILKNQFISGNVTERFSATFHSDKKSVWIMIHKWQSNNYKAYLLKNSGLDTIPVVSAIGTTHEGTVTNFYGQMKFSASGKKLACAMQDTSIIDIFDFNNATGQISNCISINLKRNIGYTIFGVEFSPSENLLYVTGSSSPAGIFQIDLSSGIDSTIKNSVNQIYINNNSGWYFCLQIGLDKKIYVARVYAFLGCINKPNKKGSACNYIDQGLTLPMGGNKGLPTFLQSYFYLPDIEIENTCLGDSTAFNLKDTTNIDSVYWSFGDSNYSWQFYPKHVYSDTGYYQTSAVIFYNNTNDTFEREIRISNYAYANFGITDNSKCLLGNEFYFYDSSTAIDGSMTYEWDFGDSTGSFQQNPIKSFLVADTFNVKLTVTSSYGCETSKTKELYVQPMPEAKININDTAQCFNKNNFIFLNPSDSLNLNVSKTWYFGDGNTSNADTAQHIYLIADTFNVVLIEETNHGCRDTATKEIIVHPSPVTEFSVNDSVQCFNENHFQFTNLTGFEMLLGLNYSWDFGNGSTSTDSNGQMKYLSFDTFDVRLVAISPLGCTDTIVKKVYILESPKADFDIINNSQCFTDNLFEFESKSDFSTLTNLNDLIHNWDFGDNSVSNDTFPTHKYLSVDSFEINLIVTASNNCKDTVSKKKNVYVRPHPFVAFSLNDSDQCLNENDFAFSNLTAWGKAVRLNYFWSFGDNSFSTDSNTNHVFQKADTFFVKLTATSNHNCKDSITKSVIVNPSPKADFSINDSAQCFNENNFEFINLTTWSNAVRLKKYFWNFGDNNFSTDSNVNHKYKNEGIFNVKLKAINPYNCPDSIIKTVTVYPSPTADFSINDSTQCLDSNKFNFVDQSKISSGTLARQWFVDDSLTSTNPAINNFSFSDWGKYPIKIISTSNKNCNDKITKNIYVHPMPVAAYIYLNNCLEDTMFFYDKSFIDSGKVQRWFWEFGDNNYSNLQNPYNIYSDTGKKAVTLTSTSDFGCSTDTTKYFFIEQHVKANEIIRATVENNENILIEWTKATKGIPKTYILEKSENGISWYELSTSDNQTFDFLDFNNRVDEQSYFYRMFVIDSCDYKSEYTNYGKTILLTTETKSTYPKLKWTAYKQWNQGIKNYELQIFNKSKNKFTLVETIHELSLQGNYTFIDSFTKINQEFYCYRIVANRKGDS